MQVSANPRYKGWAKKTIRGVGWDKMILNTYHVSLDQ